MRLRGKGINLEAFTECACIQEIQRIAREGRVDGIIVEASGVSSPMSIADAFEDEGEEFPAYLDSIVSVADANRIYSEFLEDLEQLPEDPEEEDQDVINLIIEQIEFSNIVVLNKCDLLTAEQADRVERIVKALSPEAELLRTAGSMVECKKIFGRRLYDHDKLEHSSALSRALWKEEGDACHEDYGIESFVYERREPFDEERFDSWIEKCYPGEIIRAKGYIWFSRDEEQAVLFEQAGNCIAITPVSRWIVSCSQEEQEECLKNDPELMEEWDEVYGDRINQIVFIGKGFEEEKIKEELDACLKR
ncbi:GTP-binding protein [Lachnospiraceae bacterium 54-53]